MNQKQITTAVALGVALVVASLFFARSEQFLSIFGKEIRNNAKPASTAAASPDESVGETETEVATAEPVVSLPNGLSYQDTVVGTGETASLGQTMTVNYIGVLTNGTKFDSSYDHGKPFDFRLGAGQVIKGWDEGVVGMKVGGTRVLTIPPQLGYGNQAVGLIPADSILIFQIELLGVKK